MSWRLIVPIYNAYHWTARCLAALRKASLPSDMQVCLIDDASPDQRIAGLLSEAAVLRSDWLIRRQRDNLGFVATVNAADDGQSNLLLLNTDTSISTLALLALQRAVEDHPDHGTATPWSNNAEICSLPQFCRAAPWPDDHAAVAAALASTRPSYPEIPTGVGFCMAIAREAIDQAGTLFDAATFGRGYGEENDFCRRIAHLGFKNVLCDNAYVPHAGGESFADTGHRPGGAAMQALLGKHPDYEQLVSTFIAKDPLAAARRRALTALAEAGISLPQPADTSAD